MILIFLIFVLPYLFLAVGLILALIHLICFLIASKDSQERADEKHALIVTLITFGVIFAASYGLSQLVARGVISMM